MNLCTLQDIGEEFVEFLEKELNISDDDDARANSSSRSRNQDTRERSSRARSKSNSNGSKPPPRREEPSDDSANKVENDLAEIEDMLAQLKKEMGR